MKKHKVSGVVARSITINVSQMKMSKASNFGSYRMYNSVMTPNRNLKYAIAQIVQNCLWRKLNKVIQYRIKHKSETASLKQKLTKLSLIIFVLCMSISFINNKYIMQYNTVNLREI